MNPKNLLRKNWGKLDSQELRLLLQGRMGRPGQFDRAANSIRLYLPLAGKSCRLVLTFGNNKIIAVEAGPAFDATEWQSISDQIENGILVGLSKVGREYSFSSFLVTGSWRGPLSGVQILPPPPQAPRSSFGENPFILEFPIVEAPDELRAITYYRRIREHRRWTLLLNLLLNARISCQSNRSEHFWAHIPIDRSGWLHQHRVGRWLRSSWKKAQRLVGRERGQSDNGESRQLQRHFSAPLATPIMDTLSPPAAENIKEVDPQAYYTNVGNNGSALRVPADLDESLCQCRDLKAHHRAKFDRATFWMDMASRQWTMSASSSFASLISAVESLGGRKGPGATRRFHSFLVTYAPGATQSKRRQLMYKVRSRILHGSGLMQLDQDLAFGFDPIDFDQLELHRELWGITGLALRNWLRNPS